MFSHRVPHWMNVTAFGCHYGHSARSWELSRWLAPRTVKTSDGLRNHLK
jgi:hypothetical protein